MEADRHLYRRSNHSAACLKLLHGRNAVLTRMLRKATKTHHESTFRSHLHWHHGFQWRHDSRLLLFKVAEDSHAGSCEGREVAPGRLPSKPSRLHDLGSSAAAQALQAERQRCVGSQRRCQTAHVLVAGANRWLAKTNLFARREPAIG